MKDTYKKVIEHYGADAQKVKAIEEMGELTAELARDLNGQGDIGAIIEETADVMNMMEQICIIYDIPVSVETVRKGKMDRVLQNIKPKKKTMLQDFMEKHPGARMGLGNLPSICPDQVGYGSGKPNVCHTDASDRCAVCWGRPWEDEF